MSILSRLQARLQKSLATVSVGKGLPAADPGITGDGLPDQPRQAPSIEQIVERVGRDNPSLTAPFGVETGEGEGAAMDGHQALEALRLKSAAMDVFLASLRQEISESNDQKKLDSFLWGYRIENDTDSDRSRMLISAGWHYLQTDMAEQWAPLKKVLNGFHEAVHGIIRTGLALPEGTPGRDAFVAGFSTHMGYRKTIGIPNLTSEIVFGWMGQAKTPDVVAVLAAFPAPLAGHGLQRKDWVAAFSRDPARVHALWDQGARVGFSKELIRLIRTPALLVHFLGHVGPLPVPVIDWTRDLGEVGTEDIAQMIKTARDEGHDVFAGDFSWAEENLKALTGRDAAAEAAMAVAVEKSGWYQRFGKDGNPDGTLDNIARIKKAMALKREEIIESAHARWHAQRERLVTLLALSGRIDETDAKGSTLLHRFVFRGHGEAVRALLDAGANPAIRNAEGLDAQALLALARLIRRTPIDDLGTEESLEALVPLVDRAHLDESLDFAGAAPGKGSRRL